MPAITVTGLSRRFGRTQALDNVSVEIGEGEMVALIGASGSGKSTLIRHVAGLEAADAGRITVLGNVLMGHLGRTPRWRGTFGMFNAEEKAAAHAALARVGIGERAWQRASTLSGGQQQRAAIARCLVQRAQILIADEPISALDPSSALRVMDVLADVNARDRMTVLVSLHQVEYARRYCRRTIAMRDGRIVYDGATTALTNTFLAELYGAASEELVLPEAPHTASAPEFIPA